MSYSVKAPDGEASAVSARVLVVEDEPMIASVLEMALRFLGFDTALAATGSAALDAVEAQAPDVILMDVMLPDVDGFEVCRRLRVAGDDTPVLFLTAKDAVQDKVLGLTLGGDDYVTKPFDVNEVVARIHVLLRRRERPLAPTAAPRLRVGWVELDRDAREVFRHGQVVALSATEFELLAFLLENAGKVVSRAQILRAVWNYGFDVDTGVVETYVYYLRRKLGDIDQSLIRTVRGVGYVASVTPTAKRSRV